MPLLEYPSFKNKKQELNINTLFTLQKEYKAKMSFTEMVENITTTEVANNKMYRDKLIELCKYVEELSSKHKPNYDKMISTLHHC